MYEKIKEMNEQMNNIRNIKDIYNRNARWYDFLVKPIEFFLLRKKRRKLVVPLSGKILEIGVGTGANLAYYRNDISFIGVDASPEMLKIAQRKAERNGISADFREMDAENLEFPDGYFDAVVSTLTLCTVPHPVQAVREMARVCKGGGRLLFLEHGKSCIGLVARLQEGKSGKHFQKHGCRLLSDPLNIIASAGLHIKISKRFFLGIFQQIEATASHTHI